MVDRGFRGVASADGFAAGKPYSNYLKVCLSMLSIPFFLINYYYYYYFLCGLI